MPEVTCSLDRAGLRVIDVLLVEDDPGDVLMTTEAFEMSPVRSTLHVVSDGEQALRFLRRTGEFTGAPRPGLILLDLNVPRRNGLEVLAELKADPDLLTIPVVIFSTSRAETDIAASYQLHANAYITKPVSLDLFTEAIRQVDDFFLTLVKLSRLRTEKLGPRTALESNRLGPGASVADAARGWPCLSTGPRPPARRRSPCGCPRRRHGRPPP
jgi:CheY-like chemotaxis protein